MTPEIRGLPALMDRPALTAQLGSRDQRATRVTPARRGRKARRDRRDRLVRWVT